MRGLVAAFRLLTILPVPGREPERMSSALPWFPLVGLSIGGIMWAIPAAFHALHPAGWTQGISLITVAAGVILTGGLHLDGLADWADSLGCTHDREKMLAVMKDSRTGSFGVIGLILILAGKWAAASALVANAACAPLIIAAVVSRTMTVYLCVCHAYARPEGGTGRDIVEGGRVWHLIAALALSMGIVFTLGGPAGLLYIAAGFPVGFSLGRWSVKKLGGVTGDILGAGVELTETAVLFCGAFISGGNIHL